MITTRKKFCLLLWKNFTLGNHQKFKTLFEMLIPILFSVFLVIARSVTLPPQTNDMHYPPFKTAIPIGENADFRFLAWSPYNEVVQKVMDDVTDSFGTNIGRIMEHRGFEDSHMLETYLQNELTVNSTFVGVQFDDTLINAVVLPPVINIVLRFPGELRYYGKKDKIWGDELEDRLRTFSWQTHRLFSVLHTPGPRYPNNYYKEGFLALQQEISFALIQYYQRIINNQTANNSEKLINMTTGPNKSRKTSILMRRFPFPEWKNDVFERQFMPILVILFAMFAFLFPFITTVLEVSFEKEKQLKEVMIIAGLPNWLQWLTWFFKKFVILFVPVLIVSVIFKVKWYNDRALAIFMQSCWTPMFLLLLVYASAVITSAFAITAFFSKSLVAVLVSVLFWFFPFVFFSSPEVIDLNKNLYSMLLLSLFPSAALTYGLDISVLYEIMDEGIQWTNLWKPPLLTEKLNLGYLISMLLFDTVGYMLIALYIEQVLPKQYGVARRWYFPFTRSFWCSFRKIKNVESYRRAIVRNDFYESEPIKFLPGITTLHVYKSYKKNVYAVEDLTMNIFQNQITVLLGHKGVGKTTLLHILCGIITPTSGTAIIDGYDIQTNIREIRESLGYCPQHDILFSDLTVRENLYFYTRLRTFPKNEIDREITMYLEELNLTQNANQPANDLSLEKKRKLSLCLALCGESRVVICDEPSSGLDPVAKREMWDFLKKQRKNRTILVTTQSMAEADAVGDRIAIMGEGKLICCGSSSFLQKMYKAGYQLVVRVSPECDVRKVTTLLQRHIMDIQVDSYNDSELMYLLTDDQSPLFKNMLGDLEAYTEELSIESFSISVTTMEEVFVKATTHSAHKDNYRRSQVVSFSDSEITTNTEQLAGCPLHFNQIIAITRKKFKMYVRSWTVWILLLVILLIELILPSLQLLKSLNDLPKLKIELGTYNNPITVVTDHNNSYCKQYIEILTETNQKSINWENQDFAMNILRETRANTAKVKQHYIVGASFFRNNSIMAWFNNEPFHSPPLALQLVINSILRKTVSTNHYIQFYNHPLPFSSGTKFRHGTRLKSSRFTTAYQVTASMCLVSPLFIIFYIKEKTTKVKHLQFISGARVVTFWGVSFVFDLIIYCLISVCVILIVLAFQEEGFTTYHEINGLYHLLIGYGIATLPLNYLSAYLFSGPLRGYFCVIVLQLITALLPYMILHKVHNEQVKNILHDVFLVLPSYALLSGISDAYILVFTEKTCHTLVHNCVNYEVFRLLRASGDQCVQQVCKVQPRCCARKSYYDLKRPGIGKQNIALPLEGLGFLVILLLIEYRVFKSKTPTKQPHSLPFINKHDDQDINLERRKVQKIIPSERKAYAVIIHDLTKRYNEVVAVDKLTLSVAPSECFGVLGYKGAGKTTIFKMLTGDITPSSGDIWVNGLSIKSHLLRTSRVIGYCPESGALLNELTCRETLFIFGLLRGIPRAESKRLTEGLATALDFRDCLDKYVKNLSDGTKKKLNIAIALTGDPQILYLDEPTTGLDPYAIRLVWNLLRRKRDRGKCIILTSRNMEECEALCTRLAIMINGKLVCLGSLQHLRNKFSTGYTLTIKVKKHSDLRGARRSDINKVQAYVFGNFKNVVQREQHGSLLIFMVNDDTMPCSKMFGIMENCKNTLNVEHYSLGRNTIEQLFLTYKNRIQVEDT